LNSTVREHLLGDGPPRYAGYTAWRAVVTPQRELVPQGAVESWGAGNEVTFCPYWPRESLLGRGQKRAAGRGPQTRWEQKGISVENLPGLA
jgi:hypothetical protein